MLFVPESEALTAFSSVPEQGLIITLSLRAGSALENWTKTFPSSPFLCFLQAKHENWNSSLAVYVVSTVVHGCNPST